MKKETLLYVHIPFCKQKCFYCDFPSFANIEYLREDYLNALKIEIESRCKDIEFSSLFIGGGTPSYLTEEELRKLFNILRNVKFVHGAEKTIECNPGTINKEKLEIMKEGGINRISFGLQTTNNNLLKEIGRIHTLETFEENFKLARDIGFKNINIDLMFGLPNQKLDELKETLNYIIKLNPEHISFYSLIIEEGTAFYNMYEKDILNLPSEEEERAMYSIGKEILESNGYKQYEFSNYAKSNNECFHNIGYWKLKDYIGVGSSSSSFINNKRIKNISNVKKYIDNININKKAFEEILENSKKENMEEYIFLGLRMLEGIDKRDFKDKFNLDIEEVYENEIISNIKKGLMIQTNERLKLTKQGIEVSNYVLSDFIK
ncbi:radical SAM family heme chaperone HemW [Clostridium thermobutyricum]|uniref:Heme chaperone HemW n=1 Tax=Clostridium thermobutyricum DSM 4928 TaxID=1121339 RepID=A0A1V4SPX1_9CLOT|nr:radical SAM family heme chaperone HemW [Clostridium thermobutyricum]OPX45297.1 oxygen-independent coproporphyrinogen-III oxidase-like protein YqeR [Clostridium thermobutyricum DSM 4928]